MQRKKRKRMFHVDRVDKERILFYFLFVYIDLMKKTNEKMLTVQSLTGVSVVNVS